MSDSTTPKTDQQRVGEELLQEMQAQNGGELRRDAGGRLILTHPPTTPSR